jgi:dTDP-4-amino-4,6-dideoxygalactose transaminase
MSRNSSFRHPLVDLAAEYRVIGSPVEEAVREVMASGDFILGSGVSRFEEQFAAYCGTKHCTGVSSGTAGLVLTLKALGVGSGDEVLIPAYTFKATAMAVFLTGASPVPVDVEPDTGNINPALLEKHLTPRTKAVIPVHLYGHPPDMERILVFSDRHNIFVIEDACEAHGALYQGKRAGSMGRAGVFSFYPSKNLGGCGDGGAVVTDDSRLTEKLVLMRGYGGGNVPGHNCRLSTLQAVVLSHKLKHLDEWNNLRRAAAATYRDLLKDLPVELPADRDYARQSYYLFVIKLKERESLRLHLLSRGIEARIHFEKPVMQEYGFFDKSLDPAHYPAASDIARKVLSLPMHPFLQKNDIRDICGEVASFFAQDGSRNVQ